MSVPDVRIRIAFGIDNLGIGGTELNAVRLAERLDPSRFSVRLIAMQPEGPLADRYRAAGIPIDVFVPGGLFGRGALREGRRLKDHLRRHRIQIFHAHDLYSNLFGCAWARLAGAKVIASRRWQGVPRANRGRLWRLVSRLPYHVAHVSLANSPAVAEMLARVDWVPRRRTAVVPNFVDESAFMPLTPDARRALLDELGLTGHESVVGVVANLRPVKDHATLFRAIALLGSRWPAVRVVLVGEGDSRPELAQLASDLGIQEQVIFAGRRSNDPNLNHLFDIAVLSSRKEGLPNSVLEAMAAGRPVVATDVGAVSDAVIHGETGLLAPPGDAPGFAAALETLLANPDRARRMGEAAQRRARAHYSPEAALRAAEAVYSRLLPNTLRASDALVAGATPGGGR
jgi:L-malate glycosyltransferase